MYYEDINKHMKNKFSNKEKIENIDSLTDSKLDNLVDNKIYKTNLSCLAIDIVNSKILSKDLGAENWSKIISEFTYGVEKIIKTLYNGKWITIQGDAILSIFEGNNKKDIDNVFDCACTINTFIKHLNKLIKKYLEINEEIKIGIGLWWSENNYISKVGYPGERDIVFIGDSVNYAVTLANLANRENYDSILLNHNFQFHFYNKDNNNFVSKTNTIINNENIYDCNAMITNYDNFVENCV